MSRIDQIAAEKQKRIAQLEAEYLRAKQHEKSEEFITDQLRALAKIRSIVRQGLMENAESLIVVGRVQQVVLDTYQHENVILEYEGLRKSLKDMFPQEGRARNDSQK